LSLKPVYIIKNEPRESGGLVEEFLTQRGIVFKTFDLKQGDAFPDPDEAAAMVVLGGPDSANDKTPVMLAELAGVTRALQSGTPYLGICLGMQVMVKAGGGKVIPSPVKEIGFNDPDGRPFEIHLTFDGVRDPLFNGFRRRVYRVFQLHGETVTLAPNLTLLGSGTWVPNQIIRFGSSAYGLQCHFELTPELFESWLKEDDDLRKSNPDALRRAYKEIENEYRQTGMKLVENFFIIAGVVKAPR